jgi:nucleotide-binding universal stress UspA family protein
MAPGDDGSEISNGSGAAATTGPVLFAYDGSELAKFAIEQAAGELSPGRDALVVCVWQPVDVGFEPAGGQHFDAQAADEVKKAAEETAGAGAKLAEEAGFRPQSLAVEASPTWQGIIDVAEERSATLIVLGAHRRSGIVGHLLGSVSQAVVAHSQSSVLIIQQPS